MLTLIFNAVSAQKIDTAYFNSLGNKHLGPYQLPNGKDFNERPLENEDFQVVFYSIELKKPQRILKIKGYVFTNTFSNDKDSSGAAAVQCFLARPVDGVLTHIKLVGETILKNNPSSHAYPFGERTGDFSITFKFTKGDRLFIDGSFYFPIEYNIGKLLQD